VDLRAFLTVFTALAAILILFSMGLGLTVAQGVALWRQPGLLLRSLAAADVIAPLLAWVTAQVLRLPLEVAAGLIVVAAAPGPSLGPKLAERARGDVPYAVALMATLALLASVTTPVTIALGLPGRAANPFEIMRIVLGIQLLPLGIGLAIRRFWSARAAAWVGPVTALANILFPLVVALILIRDFDAILALNAPTILGILVIAAGAVAAGHGLGGPGLAKRAPLATMSGYRNGGLALVLAPAFGATAAVVVVAYELVALILVLVYAAVVRRHINAAPRFSPTK
jgi:BASS family bile acid:Na+ symporter